MADKTFVFPGDPNLVPDTLRQVEESSEYFILMEDRSASMCRIC